MEYAHCVTCETNKDDKDHPMLSEGYDEQEAPLGIIVEVQHKHNFLSTDVRQTVDQWLDVNGDGSPALDKGHVKSIKKNGYLDVPAKSWEQVRRSLGQRWFITAWVKSGRGDAPAIDFAARRGDNCYSMQLLARGNRRKAYRITLVKLRQGDLLELLMTLANGAPYLRVVPPDVVALALAVQYTSP